MTTTATLETTAAGETLATYHGETVLVRENDNGLGGWDVWEIGEVGRHLHCGMDRDHAIANWTRTIDARLEVEAAKARKPGKPFNVAVGSYAITVTPNRSIRIVGDRDGRPVDITYSIGDSAEYGSFNLHYLGTIMSITRKSS